MADPSRTVEDEMLDHFTIKVLDGSPWLDGWMRALVREAFRAGYRSHQSVVREMLRRHDSEREQGQQT